MRGGWKLAAKVATPPLVALVASLALLQAAQGEPVQRGGVPMSPDSARFIENVGQEPDAYNVHGDVAVPVYVLDCEARLQDVPVGTPVECEW